MSEARRVIGQLSLASSIVISPVATFGQSAQHDVGTLIGTVFDRSAVMSARVAAATRLGDAKDVSVIEPLIEAKINFRAPLKEEIDKTLRKLGAARHLQRRLRSKHEQVRARGVFLLGALEDRAAIKPLLGALVEPSPSVREASALALAKVAGETEVKVLATRLLEDRDSDVRMALAQALGSLRIESAQAALRESLKTETDGFVIAAIKMNL